MTFLRRFIDQSYPPKPTFDIHRDIPDLTGKVIIVTGGNTGIGKLTIKALLLKNAKVYIASRSRERAEQAIADLKQETGKTAIFLETDLADLAKLTKAANEFKSKEPQLHILFNSGGVMVPPINDLTVDGYDLQFGTNERAPLQTAKLESSIHRLSSRIVAGKPPIKWDTLRDGPKRKAMGTSPLYDQSKYGVIAFSNELAKRYQDQGITSNAVNPGNLDTDLQRHLPSLAQVAVRVLFSHPAPLGALTQLYVGTSPETVNDNGGWFIPWARRYHHSPETRNPEVEAQLWDWIQEQRKAHL